MSALSAFTYWLRGNRSSWDEVLDETFLLHTKLSVPRLTFRSVRASEPSLTLALIVFQHK